MLTSQISFTIAPSICKSDTSHLTANTGSLTNCTFTWVSIPIGASLSSANSSITSISFTNASSYTVVLSVTSGTITTSVQHSVTINPLPLITLTQSSSTTCITSNFPMFSKPVHLSATGGLTYTWNPPPSPNMIGGSPNGSGNDVRPGVNSCFTVTGQDANGCKAMAVACVTVAPRFNIQVSPIYTLICRTLDINEYAILKADNPSALAVGLPSSYTYSWTGGVIGGILTSPLSSTIAASPSAINTYTAEMLDSLHCVSLPAMATIDVENCTDILESSLASKDLSVYPNPVKDKLQLNSNSFELKVQKLTIRNSLGQVVYIQDELKNKQEIDLSFLQAGMYFLKLQNNSEQRSFKIIKE